MPFAQDEIVRTVENVWELLLGRRVEACDPQGAVAEPPCLTGSVPIRGDWEGVVTLRCSEPLCRRLAADLFGRGPEDMESSDLRDALSELTNIIGGNLKALLPGVCRLGLPHAGADVATALPADGHQAVFRCDGHVFEVLAALTPAGSAA
jgi:hypothetical protein